MLPRIALLLRDLAGGSRDASRSGDRPALRLILPLGAASATK
jgi:hypothetical protein